MAAIIDSRKRNLPKRIGETYEELEDIFTDRHRCAEFMNMQSDVNLLTDFFKTLETKPSEITKVRTVNMKLIRRPYIQAEVGVRTDEQILDMLRDHLELATYRVKALIDELNAPFGQNTFKIIMAKRDYYLRLVHEKDILNWRRK